MHSVSFHLTSLVMVEEINVPGCHGDVEVLNGTRGFISSPGYDGHSMYKPNLVCNWLIEAPPGHIIRIMFDVSIINSHYGYSSDKLHG